MQDRFNIHSFDICIKFNVILFIFLLNKLINNEDQFVGSLKIALIGENGLF